MKKIIYILMVMVTFSCNNDSSDSNVAINDFTEGDGAGGSLARFSLSGDYLYTVDSQNLNVFSLLNPQHPVQVNTINVGFEIETLFNQDNYLFIGSRFGMFIYDITNPEEPSYISEALHFNSCDPVVANEKYAFVTLSSQRNCGSNINELQVYNIESIKKPVLINSRNLIQPKGIGLFGNYLFVCDDVIKIFNVANPEEMSLVHSIDRQAFDVIIQGNRLYVIGDAGLYQYALNPNDVTQITALSVLRF